MNVVLNVFFYPEMFFDLGFSDQKMYANEGSSLTIVKIKNDLDLR